MTESTESTLNTIIMLKCCSIASKFHMSEKE